MKYFNKIILLFIIIKYINTNDNITEINNITDICNYVDNIYNIYYFNDNLTSEIFFDGFGYCNNNVTYIINQNKNGDDIISLQEFKDQVLPQIKNDNETNNESDQSIFDIPLSERINYANIETGAVVLSCNEGAKDCKKVLTSSKDKYWQSDTNNKIFIIIGLSESVLLLIYFRYLLILLYYQIMKDIQVHIELLEYLVHHNILHQNGYF